MTNNSYRTVVTVPVFLYKSLRSLAGADGDHVLTPLSIIITTEDRA
jgi:hypothetical protein